MTKRNKKITLGSVWNLSHMQVSLKEGLDKTLLLSWGCGPQSSSSGEPHLRESLSNPQSCQEKKHLSHCCQSQTGSDSSHLKRRRLAHMTNFSRKCRMGNQPWGAATLWRSLDPDPPACRWTSAQLGKPGHRTALLTSHTLPGAS